MVIHEYQAKNMLARLGTPMPKGRVASTPGEAEEAARDLGSRVAVKAQVHVGGRGKAGGIRLAETPAEARQVAAEILGMEIQGLKVARVLVEEALEVERELYLGITLDRSRGRHVVMFSAVGGVDIEEVARQHPDRLFRVWAHPQMGLLDYHVRQLVYAVDLEAGQRQALTEFIHTLYLVYVQNDCTLAEINPLVVTAQGRLLAADAKLNFDENSLFRHPELERMREAATTDPLERRAHQQDLAYVRLDGEVGIIGNGAGLVMGTLDEVFREGGRPANFLDVGGGASAPVVRKALELVLSDPQVKGVLCNIFGGITRGDEVARGIVEGARAVEVRVPLVIRLAGTNEEEGRRILHEAGYETAAGMNEAARKIVERIREEAS